MSYENNKAIIKSILPMIEECNIPKNDFYKALHVYYLTMGETSRSALKLANPKVYADADDMTCKIHGRIIESEDIYKKLYYKLRENKIDSLSRTEDYLKHIKHMEKKLLAEKKLLDKK